MSLSPGDEPTRPRSAEMQRRAQSPDGIASTSSLPGRDSPPPTHATIATTSTAAHPSNAAVCTSSPSTNVPRDGPHGSVDNGRGAEAAVPHDGSVLPPPTASHDDAGTARQEGTTGDVVPEPGGREEEEEDDDDDDDGDDDDEGGRRPVVVTPDDTALSTANDREATELASIPPRRSSRPPSTTATMTTAGGASRVGEATTELTEAPPTARDECSERERRKCRLERQRVGWTDVVGRWWRRHVSVTVAAGGMRDHLALERTFLGYLRTSIALSMTGVMIVQLMRLQHAPNPDPKFGYYALGKPLAAVFIVSAILMVFIGAFRFWRQQNAMVRGKIYAGGWEILTIMAGSLLLTTTVFVLLLGVQIKKEIEGKE